MPFSFDEATASALRLGSVLKIKLRSTDQKALTLKGGLASVAGQAQGTGWSQIEFASTDPGLGRSMTMQGQLAFCESCRVYVALNPKEPAPLQPFRRRHRRAGTGARKTSMIITIELCPSRSWMTFGGRPSPPSCGRLIARMRRSGGENACRHIWPA